MSKWLFFCCGCEPKTHKKPLPTVELKETLLSGQPVWVDVPLDDQGQNGPLQKGAETGFGYVSAYYYRRF